MKVSTELETKESYTICGTLYGREEPGRGDKSLLLKLVYVSVLVMCIDCVFHSRIAFSAFEITLIKENVNTQKTL